MATGAICVGALPDAASLLPSGAWSTAQTSTTHTQMCKLCLCIGAQGCLRTLYFHLPRQCKSQHQWRQGCESSFVCVWQNTCNVCDPQRWRTVDLRITPNGVGVAPSQCRMHNSRSTAALVATQQVGVIVQARTQMGGCISGMWTCTNSSVCWVSAPGQHTYMAPHPPGHSVVGSN